jgi:hypothetical protein
VAVALVRELAAELAVALDMELAAAVVLILLLQEVRRRGLYQIC